MRSHAMRMAARKVQSLTFITSSISNSASFTIPSSASAGDLALFFDSALSTNYLTVPSTVVPTGFTAIRNDAHAARSTNYPMRGICSYKVLASGDPGSSITGMWWYDGLKIMLIFRPAKPIGAVTMGSANGVAVGYTDPAAQTVTASGGVAPLVVCAHHRVTATFSVGTLTFSPSPDGTVYSGGANSQAANYKVYNSAPSDTTVDMNLSTYEHIMQSFYIQVT